MSGNKNLKIWLAMALLIPLMPCLAGAKIIYVDADATGANNGSSWADAYNYIQDALADANSSAKPVEIWVAQGVYRPDEDTLHSNGTGDRTATFQLINGVTIKGGYGGFGQPDPNARDTALYQTILSGDIGRPEYKEDNCYHIFYHPKGLNLDTSAIIDGFTITGGNANSGIISWPHNTGGGMFNYGSSPAVNNCKFKNNASISSGGGMYNGNYSIPNVTNCTFTKNSATSGGGMYNSYSSPNVSNCKFYANSANNSGGGMCNSGKSGPIVNNCSFTANSAEYGGGMANYGYSIPTFTNCTFSGNSAVYRGGGMHNGANSPNVSNCTFSENSARFGGGISNDESSPDVNNCTISSNSAIYGGGMWNDTSNPYVNNCTFSENSTTWGGGIYNFSSNPNVTNCLFTENSGNYGGGIFNYDYSNPTVNNCTITDNSAPNAPAIACDSYLQSRPSIVTMLNCIIWNGPNWLRNNDNSTVRISYSDVQGNWLGVGNIDADPCFAQAGHWNDNGTPDYSWDDFWVDGDYHLKSQAGRWDANEGRWMKDEVTSLCIDAGDPASPIGLEPFPNGGIINMGAYGGTKEASKSYFGKLPCEIIVAGDINGDCKVDFKDFAFMAYHWLEEH